jgi:hypothetical protein
MQYLKGQSSRRLQDGSTNGPSKSLNCSSLLVDSSIAISAAAAAEPLAASGYGLATHLPGMITTSLAWQFWRQIRLIGMPMLYVTGANRDCSNFFTLLSLS